MKKTSLLLATMAGILWLTLLAGWIKNQIINNPWGLAFITQRTREYNPGTQISKKPICGNKKLEAAEQCEYWVSCPGRNQLCNFDNCMCYTIPSDPCWGGVCPPSYGNSHGWNPNNGNPNEYGNSETNPNPWWSSNNVNYCMDIQWPILSIEQTSNPNFPNLKKITAEWLPWLYNISCNPISINWLPISTFTWRLQWWVPSNVVNPSSIELLWWTYFITCREWCYAKITIPTIAPLPVCWNGELNPGEQCDPTKAWIQCEWQWVCTNDCKCDFGTWNSQGIPVCGNWVLEAWEQCDYKLEWVQCDRDMKCSDNCKCYP